MTLLIIIVVLLLLFGGGLGFSGWGGPAARNGGFGLVGLLVVVLIVLALTGNLGRL